MRTILSTLTGLVVLGALTACNGTGPNGTSALVSLDKEPAGKNCPAAGTRVQSGRDRNNSGVLDASEVESTLYACNGEDGATGDAGEAEDGPAGADGHAALVVTSPEAAGDVCAAGGLRIDQGIDADDDGELSQSEVQSSATVCSGVMGDVGKAGMNALIAVTDEAAGAHCTTGGQRLDSGVDSDEDGTLDSVEITKTEYFCNGADALQGLSKTTREAAGAHCADGGIRVDLGLDDDRDGTLSDQEIDGTNYVCDGADGTDALDSLVSVVDEPAGANCAKGGEKVTYGLDVNGNSKLDAGEVAGTRYVCDGAAGSNGLSALVNVTPVNPGAICALGGQRIDSGRDSDGNGTLAGAEIKNTTYVCDGSP